MGVKRPALLIGGVILVAVGCRRRLADAAGGYGAACRQGLRGEPRRGDGDKPADIDRGSASGRPARTDQHRLRQCCAADDSPADDAADDSATGRPRQPPPHQPLPIDWTALAIDELRTRANADEIPAMEEMARRLVQGVGVPKDQQAGAGWLLRAAQHGSAQSAFNVGVMYERGFVVERDSVRAVEWYRKAVDANLPMAKHHLALLLREGKGVHAQRPGGGRSAALGEPPGHGRRDVHPGRHLRTGRRHAEGSGDRARLVSPSPPSSIARPIAAATTRSPRRRRQRAQVLQATLLPGDLERAQQVGQSEFKQIVEALQPPKPRPSLLPSELPPSTLPAPALPPAAFPVPAPAQAMRRRRRQPTPSPTRQAGPRPPTTRSASSSRRWSS